MADNVAVTEGAGKTIATDDIQVDTTHTQGQVQFVKLVDGTLNGTGSVRVNQAAKANALTVAPATDITDGTYIGDIKFGEAETNSGAIKTAVELIDNAVDGNYLNVNVNAAGTDLSMNAGVLTAQTQRVTIATDDEVNNLLGTIDADTGAIKTAVELLDNAVDGAYLNVNVNAAGTDLSMNAGVLTAQTQRVTIATDDECNNFLGTIDADTSVMAGWDNGASDGASVSGDVAHDTADAGEPVKVGGKAVSFDGTVPGTAVAENDRANFITDLYGRQYVETCHPRYFNARADYAGAQTNATVQAAPGASLKLYITDIMISNGATAGNITLLDGSGGTVIWEIYTAINGGCVANFRTPIVLTANTLLAITSTTVTTHSLAIQGYIAP